MIAIEIENIKEFMSHLLVGTAFDTFHVETCEIVTFVCMTLDGKRHFDWYDTEERPEKTDGSVTWKELKPIAYQMVKGNKTPERMKLDFFHRKENGDVGSLRVEYSKDSLIVYTGYMQREFSMDKTAQQEWDEACRIFIQKTSC